jgi:glucose/arabinose dehydrogenase
MKFKLSLSIFITLMFLSVSCHRWSPKPDSGPTTISGALDGKRIVIKPDALSEPYKSGDVDNTPQRIERPAGAWPQLPAGFAATLFAEGDFKRPRNIIEAPNGDLFLSDADADTVFLLRDANADGRIDNGSERFAFLTGLNQPFGMAIRGEHFYVANTDSVARYKYQLGQTAPEGAAEKIIDLPGKGYNQHWAQPHLQPRRRKDLRLGRFREQLPPGRAAPRCDQPIQRRRHGTSRLRLRVAQSSRTGLESGDWRTVDNGQRTRWNRRRPRA